MKVVIAPDKFKGSLSSQEVANAIEEGILQAMPDCSIQKLYVADGGDGTAEALTASLRGEWIELQTIDPIGRPIVGKYGIINQDTAIIDVATASGISQLKQNEYAPLTTNTIGTGRIIADALKRGLRHIMIGVGGSATTDAGTGILHELGYRFFDAEGKEVNPGGIGLSSISRIDDSQRIPEIDGCDFTILCDVDVNYYGPNGAAYLFARQKGADDNTIEQLDNGLKSFAKVLNRQYGKQVKDQSFAGAAGSVGGTLWAVLNAKLTSGIYTILKTIRFEQAIKNADLVVTGEGRMDKLTLLGKAPYGVCGEAARNGVPTIAFVGSMDDADRLNEYGFLAVYPIQPGPITLSEAMNPTSTYENLRRASTQVFRTLLINHKPTNSMKRFF